MKILTLTENFLVGGLETRLLTMRESLRSLGHQMVIYAINIDSASHKNNDIHQIKLINKSITAIENVSVFENIILKEKPDFIDIHPFETIIPAGLASAFCRKPYSITIHGKPSLEYIKLNNYAQIITELASCIFCVSETLKISCKDIFSNTRINVCRNGVTIPNNILIRDRKQEKSLLIVSRLDSYKAKSIVNFLNIVSRSKFLRKYIKKIDLLGDGPEKANLSRIAKNKGININFLGFGNAVNLIPNYSMIGGMGRVIIESAIIGTPALILDYEGIGGFVSPKNYIELSEKNFVQTGVCLTSSEFDQQLKSVIKNPELFNCSECAEKNNNVNNITKKYTKQITEIIIANQRNEKTFLDFIKSKENKISSIKKQSDEKDNLIEQQKRNLEKQEIFISNLQQQINIITKTLRWRISSKFIYILEMVGIGYLFKFIINIYYYGLSNTFQKSYQFFSNFIRKNKKLVKHDFNPYEWIRLLKEIKVKVVDEDIVINKNIKFSLIATIMNEEEGISQFLQDIENQTLTPSEIIIVDGGSTDNTVKIVNDFIKRSSLAITLINDKKYNVPQGRNKAISCAKFPYLVIVDAGCRLEKRLCQNLIGCFLDTKVDLVGGIYFPIQKNKYSNNFVPNWNNIDWSEFLPSSRAIAVKTNLVRLINAYPEYLKSGEDTLFDINYRKVSNEWMFNKKAIVYWEAPTTKKNFVKLSNWYGKGDGQSGIGDFCFYSLLSMKDISTVDTFYNESRHQLFMGYLQGRQERSLIEINKRKINGVIIILAGVPFNDIGGGQRGTQIALEFIRQNYKVIFVNIYPSFEEKILQLHFDIDYTLLELYHINDFDVNEMLNRYKDILHRVVFITEFPHPLFRPIISAAKKINQEIKYVYDYIDNWDSSLGGEWYNEKADKVLLQKADDIIASALTLKNHLSKKVSQPIMLIANAVNTYLFNPNLKYNRPNDLPDKKPIILYIGAMYGDWFDWILTEKLIAKLTKYNFVFIGNTGNPQIRQVKSITEKYSNAIFLGPRPQSSLPAYIKFSNYCYLPFIAGHHITKYVNPLKIYEYLAMQKPVLATKMEELKDIPGIYFLPHKVTERVINDITTNNKSYLDSQQINKFIASNSWTKRISDLTELLDI